MAPTLAQSVEVDSTASNTTSLVTSAITVTNGDVLVIKVAAESNATGITTPTGGSQTYTLRASDATASHCNVAIYTAVVSGSPGTVTVTVAFTSTPSWHSMVVERWTGAQLAGTPATNSTKVGTGAPSTTLTTVAAGSVVTWVNGDWNATAPGTPAYRSSATQDGRHDKSTSFYVAYYATQAAASAGSQTMGLTAPTGQTWSLLGIEVQDAGGGAPADVPPLVMAQRW